METPVTAQEDPTTPLIAPPVDGNGARQRPKRDRGGPKNSTRMVIEWILLIGGALLIAVLIKTFLFQAFYIPSESMTPTLAVGDRVLVNKVSYDLHDVNRGDIVVFKNPEESGEVRDLVKRVVGLSGETVETREGVVFIDGVALDEPYLPVGTQSCGAANGDTQCSNFGPYEIPEGEIFVMGDNRGSSKDSRVFEGVEESQIVGRVFVRIWPVTHLGFL